ncbi:MAG: hypothetical protein EXR99_13435 [Gemmataceae bacterium]|nr:hypothetical protein [Gemmataceae bacterium]
MLLSSTTIVQRNLEMLNWKLGLTGFFVFALIGCGGSEAFSTAEVTGVVKSKGKTLDGIQVEFHPTSKGVVGQAVTDKDGKFSFKATVGKNMVVLLDTAHLTVGGKFGRKFEDVDLTKDKDGKPKAIRIPAELGNLSTTKLDKNVTSATNNIEIDIP